MQDKYILKLVEENLTLKDKLDYVDDRLNDAYLLIKRLVEAAEDPIIKDLLNRIIEASNYITITEG